MIDASTNSENQPEERAVWTFLTNHSLVLLAIAQRPESRLRDLADAVQITERAVQRIVTDLVASGYLQRTRQGRRNQYGIELDAIIANPVLPALRIRELLKLNDRELLAKS